LRYVYLVDKADEDGMPIANSRLLGVVTLQELLFQDDDTQLKEFAHYTTVSVSSDEDQKIAAELIAKHNLSALPVIDKDGHLLGTVTASDIKELKVWPDEDSPAPDGEQEDTTPTLINSNTAGDEARALLGKIGSAVRWILPQNLNWVMVWLAIMLFVYVAQINLFAHMDTLDMEALGWELPTLVQVISLIIEVMRINLFIFPLILVTIASGVLRATELSTSTTQLEPSAFMRYSTAIVIAIAHTFISYVLIIASIAAMRGAPTLEGFFADFSETFNNLTLLIFIPLLCALLICTLFAAWRIGAAEKSHKEGKTINPGRIATAAMLVFVLSFAGLTYPAAHVWNEQAMRAQEEAMMNEDWGGEWDGEDWGWEENGEWDWDADWDEDFDWGEGETIELNLEDLLGEDFGDGELELSLEDLLDEIEAE